MNYNPFEGMPLPGQGCQIPGGIIYCDALTVSFIGNMAVGEVVLKFSVERKEFSTPVALPEDEGDYGDLGDIF